MLSERLRRLIASLTLWLIFVLVYLAVTAVLAMGLVFVALDWLSAFQHQASWWVMALQSVRVIFIALILAFLVAQPIMQLLWGGKPSEVWAKDRRSGGKE